MKHARAARRIAAAATAMLLLAVVLPIAPAAAVEPPLDILPEQVFGSDSAPNGNFGSSVAIWGDTAIVGKPSQKAAHPFAHRGYEWLEEKKLVPSDSSSSGGFGRSVAVCGDTALVGAPSDDQQGMDAGKVYVFTRTAGTWSQKAILTATDVGGQYEHDWFGWSVALDGGTALIGAPGDDANKGAAYVFTGSGTSWQQRTKMSASQSAAYDYVGWSVAIDGGAALVGAPGDMGHKGAAYVFTGGGASWRQRLQLLGDSSSAGDFFGCSVALDGATALVGASGEDSRRGAAYVFMGSGAGWARQQRLTGSEAMANDGFGCSVALSGGAALVGAAWHSEGRGAAYLFTGGGNAWTERHRFAAADGEPWAPPAVLYGDQLGEAVALSGGTALVGVPLDDVDGVGDDAGSAWFLSFTYPLTPGVVRIAGANRYLTAVAASKRGFPAGAPAVVVATGANWPDALGGSALAGSAHGPLLLTKKDGLPAEVVAEIRRLGAVKAYVLGSTAAVGSGVENALVSMLGRTNVTRLGGANRYETANKVAQEAVRLRGPAYTGGVFVTTGVNYPDATAASPMAAAVSAPVLLVNPASPSVVLPAGASIAFILGSTASISAAVEADLVSRLGKFNVERVGGANRYATAALLADTTLIVFVGHATGLATGENFPDALTAGPMLARISPALVLTRPTILPGETKALLQSKSSQLESMFIFGDYNAVSASVEAQAKAAAGL